jgi:hypothetical protein
LNATAGTCEEMIKRAVFARELGVPIVMHDYLTGAVVCKKPGFRERFSFFFFSGTWVLQSLRLLPC